MIRSSSTDSPAEFRYPDCSRQIRECIAQIRDMLSLQKLDYHLSIYGDEIVGLGIGAQDVEQWLRPALPPVFTVTEQSRTDHDGESWVLVNIHPRPFTG